MTQLVLLAAFLLFLIVIILWQYLRLRSFRRPTPGDSPAGVLLRQLAVQIGWKGLHIERRGGDIPFLGIQRTRLVYTESILDLLDETELRCVLLHCQQPGFSTYMRAVVRAKTLLLTMMMVTIPIMIVHPRLGAPLALLAASFWFWCYSSRPLVRAAAMSVNEQYLAAGGDPLVYLRASYKLLRVYAKRRLIRGSDLNQERLELELLGKQAGLTLEEVRAIGTAVGAPPALLYPRLLYQPVLWFGACLFSVALLGWRFLH